MSASSQISQVSAFNRENLRHYKDVVAKYGIAAGGFAVIGAVLLMMLFFFVQVSPLFLSSSMEHLSTYDRPGAQPSVLMAMDEYHDTAMRVTKDAEVIFFKAATGLVVKQFKLSVPEGVQVTSRQVMDDADGQVVFGLSNGKLLLAEYGFSVSYKGEERIITPRFSYPLGETAMDMDAEHRPLTAVSGRASGETMVLVGYAKGASKVEFRAFEKKKAMFSDQVTLEAVASSQLTLASEPRWVMVDGMADWMYAIAEDGQMQVFSLRDVENPTAYKTVNVLNAKVNEDRRLTSATFLLGSTSLLLGESSGKVTQWFPVRDANNRYDFVAVRDFKEQDAAVVDMASEQRRKGFVMADKNGEIGLYHATAHRVLGVEKVSTSALSALALGPRADSVLLEDVQGNMHLWQIENEHPEVSFEVLWQKVWYEGYPESDYIWQSSSSASDFEPKFSLAPLAFGTLKAAFYAMMVAVPIAIMAAMFAGFFMAPAMRQTVKPTIELLEALPTVIIGFLAGLWLAPYLEKHMPAFFMFLFLLPALVFAFGYAWSRLPDTLRTKVPEGWQAMLLIPVVLFALLLASVLDDPMEVLFFGGDMPMWLTNVAGIGYDQRNSLVVGIAMGLAVIPIIFSIAEDAIYNVPKHQVNGSLALGASPWQTMMGVVLPTASPGLFSATMIGFGRAVGETMIVLMATGNTPIMDANIFEGLRTLSANIAVEMPEAEVASTHYRVLFLAALVLFMFTFFFNTIAETVRQRMLKRYGAL
jgi:phosphate transport system permease protein